MLTPLRHQVVINIHSPSLSTDTCMQARPIPQNTRHPYPNQPKIQNAMPLRNYPSISNTQMPHTVTYPHPPHTTSHPPKVLFPTWPTYGALPQSYHYSTRPLVLTLPFPSPKLLIPAHLLPPTLWAPPPSKRAHPRTKHVRCTLAGLATPLQPAAPPSRRRSRALTRGSWRSPLNGTRAPGGHAPPTEAARQLTKPERFAHALRLAPARRGVGVSVHDVQVKDSVLSAGWNFAPFMCCVHSCTASKHLVGILDIHEYLYNRNQATIGNRLLVSVYDDCANTAL